MRKISTLAYLCFLMVLFAASLAPNFLDEGFETDKMMHITFVCLALLYPCLAFEKWRSIFLLCGLLFSGSLLVEFLQTLTPDRHAEINDVLANLIGLCMGLIIGYLIRTGYYAEINMRRRRKP